jgi:hypothetical protein
MHPTTRFNFYRPDRLRTRKSEFRRDPPTQIPRLIAPRACRRACTPPCNHLYQFIPLRQSDATPRARHVWRWDDREQARARRRGTAATFALRLRGPFSNTNSAAQARGSASLGLRLGTFGKHRCAVLCRRRTDPQNEIFFKTIHYVISRYVDRGPHRAHADSPTARHAGAYAVWPSRWPRDKRTCVTSVIVRSSKLMASNSRFAHLIQSSESLSDGRPRFHLLAC